MSKEDFLNDLEKCINSWWDSLPPEIQDDINALYDKFLDAELNEQKQIINLDRVDVFERVRDLRINKNQLYLFMESSASIGLIKL